MMKTIGFIGLGNMGSKLAHIVIQENKLKYQIFLGNRSLEKAEKIVEEVGGKTATNQEIFEQAEVIFLGVKPHQFTELLEKYNFILEKRDSVLLISMAAGLTLQQLDELVPNQHRLIRIMPNTPVAVREGVVTYSLSHKCTTNDEELIQELLSSVGSLVRLDESQLDAATAVAGCGPAFVYLFLEALADAGVKNGLPRELALKLANQTLLGSAVLAKETNLHPAVLKDQVCSPSGSTIAGVASLEQDAFRSSVINAVDAAYKRTQELSN